MRTKKLMVGILVFISIIIAFAFLSISQAASLGKLTITKERKTGTVTYKHQIYSGNENTKNVWKLVKYNEGGTTTKLSDIYCLRAGLGFTSETATVEGQTVLYNQSITMSKKDITQSYKKLLTKYSSVNSETTLFDAGNSDNFYAVLWILDNMLLEDANDEAFKTYLKEKAGYSQSELDRESINVRNVLTREDVEAIQQLAIWYFTNYDETEYHNVGSPQLTTLYLAASGDIIDAFNTKKDNLGRDIYDTFAGLYTQSYGTKRQEHANTLYTNLIERAIEAVKANGGIYTPKRDITIYLAGTDFAVEQPVVQVIENPNEPDISLRKFISAINGESLPEEASREPQVDTSVFNTEVNGILQTTAIYNHPKKPVSVKIGDVVTYTIRLYNEGEVDAYITEITDYLPNYLAWIVPEGQSETENYWELSEGGYVAKTTEYCEIVGAGGKLNYANLKGKTLGEVLIPAAEKNTNVTNKANTYTLSYVDIEISCVVMDKAVYDEPITNIAEVTGLTDANGASLIDRDSIENNVNILLGNTNPSINQGPLPNYKQNELEKAYVPGQEDDDDFDKVIVESPTIDLALRKFISKIGDINYNRVPVVKTEALISGLATTATYEHSKEPIEAYIGDVVTYKIRVYNEGELDASVTQITDYISNYLKYVPFGDDTNGNWWTSKSGTQYNTVVSNANCPIVGAGGKLGAADIAGKTLGDGVIIPAFDKQTNKLSYIEVEIHCQIMKVDSTIKLTNIAEITEEWDEYGRKVINDKDSKPGSLVPNGSNLPNYKDSEIDKLYVPGQEDDDDFEKVLVKVPEVDIALRKFISALDGKELIGEDVREPSVKTDALDTYKSTTAEYEHSKIPLPVKKGSEVVYTIRLYNEGEINAYVSEVTDYLPNYLTYLPNNEINQKYGWVYNDETREVKTTITSKENELGSEVYQDRQSGKLLIAYDGNGVLNYIDVQIVCKVNENVEGNTILTNLAQITKMEDEKGNIIAEDRDSKPDGDKEIGGFFEIPSDKDRPYYKDDESNKAYVPGQEDDDDFEKVLVKPDFDLALRKFITGLNNSSVNNRYPEVSYADGKITYDHTKEPFEVEHNDIVIYTIRVYNEGQAAGFADEITDDMPEGLEFLPDNETNKEYRWKMLDENEEETDDVSKAKYIVTDYLSEEQQKETGRDNEIKAFNPDSKISDTNPDYRDVKVAFRVEYKATTKEEAARIIKNVAQISKDSDDDIDSEPNRDELYDYSPDGENEDDIDYDNIKVKYFDLSLLKWVSQTKVTLNGEEVIKDTGHTVETAKNEEPVQVQIAEKDINSIIVKFVYTIRITNEGEINGYATEVKDYIPEGLKFDEEDNKDWNWKIVEDGVVVTDYLSTKELEPGSSAEVPIVLTWINSGENLGEKVNLAEISKDKNNSDSPDIDSTPDNKVPEEDDIDDAPVILAVNTGGAKIYIGLIAIILITFGTGVGLIKKYVLE